MRRSLSQSQTTGRTLRKGQNMVGSTMFHVPDRVNLLCLVGATVGVLALLTPWCFLKASDSGPGYDASTPFNTGSLREIMSPSEMRSFSILMIAGTLISFISPVGGGLQVSGILLFLYNYVGGRPAFSIPEIRIIPGFGALFAIISSGFVLASLLWPMGIGYPERIEPLRRLLAVRGRAGRREEKPSLRSEREPIEGFGAGLILSGFGSAAYGWGMALTFDSFAVQIAHSNHILLLLSGCLGLVAGLLGYVLSRPH